MRSRFERFWIAIGLVESFLVVIHWLNGEWLHGLSNLITAGLCGLVVLQSAWIRELEKQHI